MKKILLLLIILTLPGCGNLSPQNDLKNDINNQHGQIEELKNLQNAMNLELGKLRQEAQVNAQELRNLQQGIINYNKDNSGIQILQGDGALVLVFGIAVVALILIFHYREKLKEHEATVDLLAEQIVKQDNLDLEDGVFIAAMDRGIEKTVLDAIVKHQKRFGLYHMRHQD
jgi:hypothetical protein